MVAIDRIIKHILVSEPFRGENDAQKATEIFREKLKKTPRLSHLVSSLPHEREHWGNDRKMISGKAYGRLTANEVITIEEKKSVALSYQALGSRTKKEVIQILTGVTSPSTTDEAHQIFLGDFTPHTIT